MLIHSTILIRKFVLPKCIRVASFSSHSSSNESPIKKSESDQNEDWFNVETGQDIAERVVPKPVSYLPDHLPQTRRRIRQKPWWKFRYFVDVNTLPLVEESEYTEKPQYPPIFNPDNEGFKKKIRLEWYEAIRKLPSAEEKIYEITKHYSHLNFLLEPVMKSYNMLPIQKYITKTHLLNQLPDSYSSQIEIDDSLKQQILSLISSRLYSTKSRLAKKDYKKSSLPQFGFGGPANSIQTYKDDDIIADVVQLIRNYKNPTNFDYHIDYNPFVSSSWWVGDFPIPFKKQKWFKNDTHNQCFIYNGNHSLHMRTETPLSQIVSIDNELCFNSKVSKWEHNLLNLGVPLKRRNIVSLPGFWPEHSGGFDFPYLLALSRENLRLRKEKAFTELDDDQDVLNGMAITSAFSWLTSLANNLGFTIYDHLTYPLVTNIIITDGQFWSFFVYQLNNHCFHEDVANENDPVNLCWSSGDMKLFDDYNDGQLTNVNSNVLDYLIKFLTIKPETNINYDLRPYLSNDKRSQQEKDELSYSLRRKFAHQTDNFIARRKKTNLWETIYKNHKEALLDVKRTRPKIEMKYPPFFK